MARSLLFETRKGFKTISQIYSDPDFKEIIKVCKGTAIDRLRRGWDLEKALSTPPMKNQDKGRNNTLGTYSRLRKMRKAGIIILLLLSFSGCFVEKEHPVSLSPSKTDTSHFDKLSVTPPADTTTTLDSLISGIFGAPAADKRVVPDDEVIPIRLDFKALYYKYRDSVKTLNKLLAVKDTFFVHDTTTIYKDSLVYTDLDSSLYNEYLGYIKLFFTETDSLTLRQAQRDIRFNFIHLNHTGKVYEANPGYSPADSIDRFELKWFKEISKTKLDIAEVQHRYQGSKISISDVLADGDLTSGFSFQSGYLVVDLGKITAVDSILFYSEVPGRPIGMYLSGQDVPLGSETYQKEGIFYTAKPYGKYVPVRNDIRFLNFSTDGTDWNIYEIEIFGN